VNEEVAGIFSSIAEAKSQFDMKQIPSYFIGLHSSYVI